LDSIKNPGLNFLGSYSTHERTYRLVERINTINTIQIAHSTHQTIHFLDMTQTTSMEATLTSLETKCGWKGVLKSSTSDATQPSNELRIPDKRDVANFGGDRSHATTDGNTILLTSSMGSLSTRSLSSVDESWLGGEPLLMDKSTEHHGLMDILSTLTASEIEQIQAFDKTMPIRHLRAEKVCSFEYERWFHQSIFLFLKFHG
jgi:hypothetical protein